MTTQKQQAVPALRFSEFFNLSEAEGGGEWSIITLDEIGKIIRGSSPRPKGDPRFYGGTVPRLMVQDVTRDGKYVTPSIDFLTEEGAKRSRPCKAGTLTIVCSGTVGIVCFLAVDACIHDGFLALIDIDTTIIFDEYLYQQLSTLRDRFERGATHGGVFTNLTTTAIKEFSIVVPKIPEQQKIASFLSAVDSKIEQLGKKKALWEQTKKGMMQKLFNQALRFKDEQGNDFPDWEEKRLGDIATKTSSSLTAQSLEMTPGEYPVFGASGIAGFVNFYNSDSKYISVIKDGAGVGRVSLCPKNTSVLGTLDSIVAKAGNITSFVYHWLSTMSFERYKTGSTIPHVYFRDYSKKKDWFAQEKEQQKIANFLSAIDQKIDLIASELEKAQTFKKGLLQQMFV